MTDTPETDAMAEQCQRQINIPTNPVPAEFARKLERERDEARSSSILTNGPLSKKPSE